MNAPTRMSILSKRTTATDRPARLGGKIRPGIKVLSQNAAKNPEAVKIYNDGIKKRMKFSDIEKIVKDLTKLEYPMYPMNSQHFYVSASDFPMPETAEKIIEMYGEIRGDDTEKKLYRFPIVFFSDDLLEIYPNRFKCHGMEPSYESHYGEDGNCYCRYLAPVTKEMLEYNKANRIKKPPRREMIVRKLCDESTCLEMLHGHCKFEGRLNFYIPGIPTSGMIGLDTRSEGGSTTIWKTLSDIYDAFGHIPKHNPNRPGAPLYYITKVQKPCTWIDPNGTKRTGLQWLPTLVSEVDIGAILTRKIIPIQNQSVPAAWGKLPAEVKINVIGDNEVSDHNVRSNDFNTLDVDLAISSEKVETSQTDPLDRLRDTISVFGEDAEDLIDDYLKVMYGDKWADDSNTISLCNTIMSSLAKVGPECGKCLMQIRISASIIELNYKQYMEYLSLKFGQYKKDLTKLNSIKEELESLADLSPDQANAYIKAEMVKFKSPV